MSRAPLKHLLAKHFPWARRALHAMDGRALERLERDLTALARAVEGKGNDPTLAGRALEEMNTAGRRPALAWLGPSPYDETGIGRFSLECVRAAPFPVDYFAPPRDVGQTLAWSLRLAEEGPHRLLPMELIGYAAALHAYRAVLISLGNSDHNLPALAAFEQLDRFGAEVPVWLHVHDPLALNIVWRIAREDPRLFASMLRAAYGPEAVPETKLAAHDFSELIERGILGLRAVVRGRAIERVIVNSGFAADLVARELEGLPSAEQIVIGFHPIFPTKHAHTPPTDVLRVGSFGVPGLAKRTEVIHRACALLREAGERVELLLAGYDMDRYFAAGALAHTQWVSAFDAPSDRAFDELMASVSVAVQLRRDALGESSGVMAQLTAIGTPTIASDIGAFREYAGAVALVAPDINSEALARSILEARAGPSPEAAALRRSRAPGVWWTLVLDACGGETATAEPTIVRRRA